MSKNFNETRVVSESQIIKAIGSQHYQMHQQSPLLMLFAIPIFLSLALFLYYFFSGTLFEHYAYTSSMCLASIVSCSKIMNITIPHWLIFRSGLVLTSIVLYFPMRWAFHAKRWKLWWRIYFLYGYISIIAISLLLAGWMYFVPYIYKSWASLLETLIIFVFLTQSFWKLYDHPVIERVYKIGMYLTGISGILGAVGAAIGGLLAKNNSLAIAMFLIFLGYLVVVPLTALSWNKKIWDSNPWLLEKNT